ncbi:hypothetical protein EFL26_00870 [Nocardioides pocheonensis]|uniref:AAA+ ATPase domain-containing protein n=2 Tax=Nocardioides pocheonensis TaxID=661485 RepID=A0A3N0GY32_9ACTN|nr:hypothetical protein EFL26_00870 [Nocardioides pocheonensis]
MGVSVQRLTIGQSEVALPSKGVTAIVGGNNVGKSTVLRELVTRLSVDPGQDVTSRGRPVLVHDLRLETEGTADDVLAWLRETAHLTWNPVEVFVNSEGRGHMPPAQVVHFWTLGDRLGSLHEFMVHFSDPMSREGMLGPAEPRGDITNPPTHPLHRIGDDAKLFEEVNDICQEIFRVPLTLDRLSTNHTLRVGIPSVTAPPIDRVTAEYREALGTLPPIMSQGQGMKSLLGLLLPVVTATRPIIVIDEPEAFLHPPQAFDLGRILASMADDRGVQVILATHDRNLLAGLLDPGAPVSVVRLDRVGDDTSASQLAADDLATLWNDPVLRYSNVLDGVFHRLVVLAEADGDCRFYAAALDSMNRNDPLSAPPSEVLFVPSGGKDGMPKIARALGAVNVRVVASPDFDIFDDEAKLRRLVEAFGGRWADFADDYRVAISDLLPRSTGATCGDVLQAIQVQLEPVSSEPWTQERKEQLRPTLRTSQSGMSDLKRYGARAFRAGGAPRAAALLDKLAALGICPVREGELESLAPELGVSKGPAWLAAALKAGVHENEATKAHIGLLIQSAAVPG